MIQQPPPPLVKFKCLTGKFAQRHIESENFVLYSPTKANCTNGKLLRGQIKTLWDCHTYYLKKFKRDPLYAMEHYLWFADRVAENFKDGFGITVIAPDCDWMPVEMRERVEKVWLDKCFDIPQLKVPGTFITERPHNVVGLAVRRSQIRTGVCHWNWTHVLGQVPEDFQTHNGCQYWTTDSVAYRNED